MKQFFMKQLPPKHKARISHGKLEYVVSGAGCPVMVLFNSAAGPLEGWFRIYSELEKMTTVLAYNRFGVGGSDKPNGSQTGETIIAALRELLALIDLRPPYLLVAHSLGGLYANLFARLFPVEVAAVVLLEASHPGDVEQLPSHQGLAARVMGRLFTVFDTVFAKKPPSEIQCAGATARQIAGADPFPQVPLTVVSGAKHPPRWLMPAAALEIRRANQRELAALSCHGKQVIAQKSGYFPQITQPDLIVDVVREIYSKVSPQHSKS